VEYTPIVKVVIVKLFTLEENNSQLLSYMIGDGSAALTAGEAAPLGAVVVGWGVGQNSWDRKLT
jgi:hypothetical protein